MGLTKASLVLTLFCVLLVSACWAKDAEYDPLSCGVTNGCKQFDLKVSDKTRNREIPVRIYLPATTNQVPAVLFSHGLGGSREGSAYLGKHWSARNYVAVFLQHPGSDFSVWKDISPAERMNSMRSAANFKNLLLRIRDVTAVLDQLERWTNNKTHVLYRRIDTNKTGMSGHSFGAVTTQAVSGQNTPIGKNLFREPRIDAAVILSPSTPKRGKPAILFKDVNIPWLLMTGTKDLSVIGNADMKSRLGVFPALPPGNKYELVLKDAEHSAFTERALPGDTLTRNKNHHRVILALSTAFWDAYLKEDDAARKWLNSKAPLSIMQKDDSWKKK